MSNHAPLTCGVLAGEQCDLAGFPDDHEQSGTVVMAAGANYPGWVNAASYRELSVGFLGAEVRDDGTGHGMSSVLQARIWSLVMLLLG